ncbi:MAG: HAMP domain-containing histidine kinase [Candidatus Pacebacteria bacterium]|nr:HAMP domain-containing histidine kinase [Candidatus Paceibacterota bacterium]
MLKTFKAYLSLKSKGEDNKRREMIIKIIALVSFCLSFIAVVINLINYFLSANYSALSPIMSFFISLLFAFIWFLADRKHLKTASLIIIFTYLLPTAYFSLKWGADLPQTLLLYALAVVMSGILLSSRWTFIISSLISLLLISLTYLQKIGTIKPDLYWTSQYQPRLDDAIVASITFLVMAVLIWLYNSEISRSLQRARKSEKALKHQKDNLEKMVIERTKQIKLMQTEKMTSLYQMAEFGRLSAGMFHDLANPLTAVSLNLEQVSASTLNKSQDCLKQALLAANKMNSFIFSIKKQIQRQDTEEIFNINEEIRDCLKILDYKARKLQVESSFSPDRNTCYLKGSRLKFNQVILNLISNAIDSYDNLENKKKTISITTKLKPNLLKIEVKDNGQGIKTKNLKKIFEPFFTTKTSAGKGMGIGLYSSLHIIKHHFKGSLKIKSKWSKGSVAEVLIPLSTSLENERKNTANN